MINLAVVIIMFGLLILIHELGHFIAARKRGVRVEKFSLGFGPQLFSKKKGDTEYSICSIPLGGFVKLAGDNLEEYKGNKYEYFSKAPGERFQIIFLGPLFNYVLGFLCFWAIFFAGYPTLTTRVGGLMEGFGAKKAGLQALDRITAVDGKRVKFWEELQDIIQSKREADSVLLSVVRENRALEIRVNIKEEELSDQLGRKHNIGLLGITPFDETVKIRHGLAESFRLSIRRTFDLTLMTYKGLWYMVTGKLSVRDSVAGPLGIFDITSKAASKGLIQVVHLMGVLSVSLAIFNLLPLPVLDGGHILLLGLERIRGRALSLKVDRLITQAGLTLIISLVLFVTYNDILRLFGDKVGGLFK